MVTKFKLTLMAAALGALAMASCQKSGDEASPKKDAEYDIEIEGGSGTGKYDIEICGLDGGATKAISGVELGIADLGDKHSQGLHAKLKVDDGTGWVYVEEGKREFTWESSATDLASFSTATTETGEKTVLSAHDNTGSNYWNVSATLDGIEVVKKKTYPVNVADDKAVTWQTLPETFSKDVEATGVLAPNFSGTFTVTTSDANLKVGTSSGPGGNTATVTVGSSTPTPTLYFKYIGTTSATVKVTAASGSYKNERNVAVSATVKRKPVKMTATYTKKSPYGYLYDRNVWNAAYGVYEVIVEYDSGEKVNVSGSANLKVGSSGVAYEKATDILVYPSSKTWGGTDGKVEVTYTETYDGGTFTDTKSQSGIKYGPIINALRFDVEGGLYSRTVSFLTSGNNRHWTWQTYDEMSGTIPCVYMNIPSQYKGATFTVTAVNAEKEEKVIYTGSVGFTGGTGVGISYGDYYWFKDYFDYGMGYCYFGSKE